MECPQGSGHQRANKQGNIQRERIGGVRYLNNHNRTGSHFKSLNLFISQPAVNWSHKWLQIWRHKSPSLGIQVFMLGWEALVLQEENPWLWSLKMWTRFPNYMYKGFRKESQHWHWRDNWGHKGSTEPRIPARLYLWRQSTALLVVPLGIHYQCMVSCLT